MSKKTLYQLYKSINIGDSVKWNDPKKKKSGTYIVKEISLFYGEGTTFFLEGDIEANINDIS